MVQLYMIQPMLLAIKLPGWMTDIFSWVGDGLGQAANAIYETVLSPMLTWLGGIMFAQGRALLNCGFSIWKSCTQVALNFVQKNPEGQFGAWSVVSGSGVYGVFLAIAGSLTIFYFVAGWLKESMDEELKRIEEEIRKAKEKRQALEDRKNRRMKQIRAKQERDRAFWLKKMSAVLDRTLSEMKGKTYFYEVTQEQIAYALKKGGIPETVPEDTQKKAANEAEKAGSGTGAEKKEAGR